MKRRPYGISYDGKPCTRYSSLRLRNQMELHNELKVALSQDSNQIGKSSSSGSTIKLIEESDSGNRQNNQLEETIVYDGSSYVEQFLNLTNPGDDDVEKERSSQVGYDYLNQTSIDILSRASSRKLILVGEKTVTCSCGRRYTRLAQFRIHKKKYTSHELKPEYQEYNLEQNQFTVDKNWSHRILQALLTLNIKSEVELNGLMNNLKLFTINLNLNLESEKALFDFYQADEYDRVKLSVLWFATILKQFCETHIDLKSLWMLSFKKFGLAANIYYDWVTNKRKISHSVETNYNISTFLLQMFLIFNQWSHECQYTSILIKKYGSNIL